MALFAKEFWEQVARDGIVVRDEAHFNELYTKYRDELFMRRHGLSFLEWKVWVRYRPKPKPIWTKSPKGKLVPTFGPTPNTFKSGVCLRHRTARKDWAAGIVAANWRVRKRLPKVTAYALRHGFIDKNETKKHLTD